MSSSFGYTDTLSATKNVAVPQLSFATDFTVQKDEPSEVVLTNMTSPLDQPETIRFAITPVKDIYSGTAVPMAARAAAMNGISLLVQVNDILRTTVEGSTCNCLGYYDTPISVHMVIRAGINQYVTTDNVMSVVKRQIASLFASGTDVTNARLSALLRGSLKPADM